MHWVSRNLTQPNWQPPSLLQTSRGKPACAQDTSGAILRGIAVVFVVVVFVFVVVIVVVAA